MQIERKKFLLLGVGGIGMSALARMLIYKKSNVMGWDSKQSKDLKKLEQEGISVINDLEAVSLNGVDYVVYSNAIPKSHPFIEKARQTGVPVFKRGEVLSSMVSGSSSVAVTGSHGKTTVTFLIFSILKYCGKSPSVYGGGIDLEHQANFVYGKEDWLIAELDESDRTFVKAKPKIALITNMDYEHVDEYSSEKEHEGVFKEYIKNIPPHSVLIINGDDVSLRKISREFFRGKDLILCGKQSYNDYLIKEAHTHSQGLNLIISHEGKDFDLFSPVLFGEHHAYNLTFAFACAQRIGLFHETIINGVEHFQGVRRRFEIISSLPDKGVLISDYGHHPSEISAVIKGVRKRYPHKKIVVVWEPHRYSRIRRFMIDFLKVLKEADTLLVTDVYDPSETDTFLDSLLFDSLQKQGVERIGINAIPSVIKDRFINGEVVLLFTAGELDHKVREFF